MPNPNPFNLTPEWVEACRAYSKFSLEHERYHELTWGSIIVIQCDFKKTVS